MYPFHKRSDEFSHFTPKPWEQLQNPGSNSKTLGAATPPSVKSLPEEGQSKNFMGDRKKMIKFLDKFLYMPLNKISYFSFFVKRKENLSYLIYSYYY